MDLLREFLLEATSWDYQEFARVWSELGGDRNAVAKRFGSTPENVSAMASYLRREYGFDLERGKKGRKKGELPTKKELPTQDEFIRVLNGSQSLTSAARQFGLSPMTVKRLADELRLQGIDVKEFSGKGRKKAFDMDERLFARIWEKSDDLDQVIDNLVEMGLDLPPEKLRTYVTMMKYRVNVSLRAQGKPDLKRMPWPTTSRLKRAKASQAGLEDTELEDLGLDDEPWGDKTDPDQLVDDEPNQSSDIDISLDEPEEKGSDEEFARVWNDASSFKDAVRNLQRIGWGLTKDEIKEKAVELEALGTKLKRLSI